MDFLPDQPRCGARSKLSDAFRSQLKAWIDGEPLTCRALISRLTAECEVIISASILRNELKLMGYLWQRTRYSLKNTQRTQEARS